MTHLKNKQGLALWIIVWAMIFVAGCEQKAPGDTGDLAVNKLKVVATTTLVGDVVRQVGGDLIDLTVLLPVGADPHSFDPSPKDIAQVADADIVFANGAGLEVFLAPLLENAGGDAAEIAVSEGITLLEASMEHDHEGEEDSEEDAHHHSADPHTWTDPNNVIVWVDNIEAALVRLDAAHADVYKANADAYRSELQALDNWVREQVAQLSQDSRKLVTDHTAFTYFVTRYGFEQVGAVVPGYSTSAQPSAQDMASLEDHIREYGVKAVFVGNTVNPDLAERVAEDTGVNLVFLYTGSLTEAGGEAGTYLEYMRYNVSAIVGALK